MKEIVARPPPGVTLDSLTRTTQEICDVLRKWSGVIGFAPAAPSSGTYLRGNIIFNSEPSAGGKVGWVCVTAGTPGTWKAFGDIAL
jgi:hypothetical protein